MNLLFSAMNCKSFAWFDKIDFPAHFRWNDEIRHCQHQIAASSPSSSGICNHATSNFSSGKQRVNFDALHPLQFLRLPMISLLSLRIFIHFHCTTSITALRRHIQENTCLSSLHHSSILIAPEMSLLVKQASINMAQNIILAHFFTIKSQCSINKFDLNKLTVASFPSW